MSDNTPICNVCQQPAFSAEYHDDCQGLTNLTLGDIASRIFSEQEAQGKKVSKKFPEAFPYLDAMLDLEDMKSMYIADNAKTIVAYFLSNASSMRGPVIKAARAELKARIANA